MDQREQLKLSFWLCVIAKEKEKEHRPGLQSAEHKYGTGKVHL